MLATAGMAVSSRVNNASLRECTTQVEWGQVIVVASNLTGIAEQHLLWENSAESLNRRATRAALNHKVMALGFCYSNLSPTKRSQSSSIVPS